MLFEIAFVSALTAPLPVAVPLLLMRYKVTASLRFVVWLDERLPQLAASAAANWAVALALGIIGWGRG